MGLLSSHSEYSDQVSHLIDFIQYVVYLFILQSHILCACQIQFLTMTSMIPIFSSSSFFFFQFAVLQDGFSRRINFERSQPLPYNAAGSHFVKESSWMQRFRYSGKHNNISVNLQECSTFCSEVMLSGRKRIFTHQLSISGRPCVCHESQQDAVGNIAGNYEL